MITAVLVAMNQVGLPLTGIDDAHIFFVYAKNLAAGDGLVYNPGGERVEGFSSLLWLLITSFGYLVLPSPERYVLAVSVLIVSGAVAVLALRIGGRKGLGLAGAVLIAWTLSSPAYVTWMSLTLMDTALWSVLLLLGVALTIYGKPIGLAFVVSAMILARPEGMLWAPALIIIAALPLWVAKGPWAALREYRMAIVATLVTLAALTIWRLLYFGYPLPNTYYVKMSPDTLYNLGHGLKYLIAFLYSNPIALLGIIPAIVALLVNGRWFTQALMRPGSTDASDPRLRYIAISLIVLLALLVPVYMGGDHFGNFRFYQPAWPLFILPALALLGVLKIQAPRPVGYVAAFLVIAGAFLLPRANWFNQGYTGSLEHEITTAQEGQEVARSMNQLFSGVLPSVGVIRAGAVALAYDGEVYDLIGLNNTAMAHSPGERKGLKNHAAFNADVFFDQRPALMLPAALPPETDIKSLQEKLTWDNAVLKGLLVDPRFTAAYDLVTISDGQETILTYIDRSLSERLVASGLEIEQFVGDVLPITGQ
jgi:hypothetical protein